MPTTMTNLHLYIL